MNDARGGQPAGKAAAPRRHAGPDGHAGKPQLNRPAPRIGVAGGRYSAGALSGATAAGATSTAGTAAAAGAKRRLPLPVVLGLMLVGGMCALLALNTASAALEVEQRGLADTNATATDNQQQLLRDLAAKQAPGALASAAAALGLVPNKNPAFLRINANGSVTVLGSPVPAVAAPAPAPTATAPRPSAPKPSATPTGSPRPSAAPSKAAPVVTVTVTRSAPPAPSTSTKPRVSTTPTRAASPRTSTTSPGGH